MKKSLETDDFLSILLYIIVKAKIPNLLADCKIIEIF